MSNAFSQILLLSIIQNTFQGRGVKQHERVRSAATGFIHDFRAKIFRYFDHNKLIRRERSELEVLGIFQMKRVQTLQKSGD